MRTNDKKRWHIFPYRNMKKQGLSEMELTILLYKNGYPPEWNEEVFDKVMEQAENLKKYR